MAINLASKYSDKVVERYNLKALTDRGLNNDYDWQGVKSVKVYSVPSVALGDYTRSGMSRYGTPTELQDTVQELIVTKDRSFSITIDKGNSMEQMNIKKAGQVLARQTDEEFTPEFDAYKLATWGAKTGIQTVVQATIDKTNAYTTFLSAQEKLDEEKVPVGGRLLYCTPSFYNLIKQDSNFVKTGDVSQEMLRKGIVGDIDGVTVIKVPTSYMPANTKFILIHPSCSTAPLKLQDYKVHEDPVGVNGTVLEGRYIYDCFVFDTKVKAICKHAIA